MNLLEHYIKEIHSVQDVSDKFEKATYSMTKLLMILFTNAINIVSFTAVKIKASQGKIY